MTTRKATCRGLFLSLLCPLTAAADPLGSGDGLYFYDASGRRDLVTSKTDFVVRVDTGVPRDSDGWPTALPRFRSQDATQSLALLENALGQRGVYIVRGASRDALEQTPGVVYVLPVLYLDDEADTQPPVPIIPNDRIIARFQKPLSHTDLDQLSATYDCDIRRSPWGTNRYLLTVHRPDAVNPIAVANTLHERRDLAEYAHPDFYLPKIAYSPPGADTPLGATGGLTASASVSVGTGLPAAAFDPYYLSHQWHLDGDVDKGAAPNTDVNVEAAWDAANGPAAEGSPTVRVAVLDECVEKYHPDLFPNWSAGLNLDVDPPTDDPSPTGGQRHGTSCAGLAVAAGNDIGVRGAAPRCGLIGVKFFGATISETADGFYFAVDPNNDGDHSDGAAVISNSWGFANGTLQPPDVVNSINFAANNGRNGLGTLVLFAAANNDHTVNGVSALAQLPTVMAIGGTNSNGEHTEFSDVGPELAIATPTNDRGDDGVRLPWLDITTTDNTGSSGYNGLPDPDYTNAFGGTSAATPLAAGILALILSQDESMTAAQVRAILQHTAVRVDEPYGRFDPVTGHSHRLGYGRADAGQAVTAAHAGLRWPDRIKTLSVAPTAGDVTLTWQTPTHDYAGTLVVSSSRPFAWRPTDGTVYKIGQEVAPGLTVLATDVSNLFVHAGASNGPFFYAVYPRSAATAGESPNPVGAGPLYGFGAKAHIFRNGVTAFYDSSEGPDPGWTHGGDGDEWQRGVPTSVLSIFSQAVGGSGPLAGLNGTRAIGGNKCWGTDLVTRYDPNADAYLRTPLINLIGVSAPVFLEYYDWCLLETYYDRCSVEVVDPAGNFLGYLDPDTGGDYDWTRRVYDLTPYAGQAIKVDFRITSDGLLQRDGWFLDEVRITVAADVNLPPVAHDRYAELSENQTVNVFLSGVDPNPGTALSFVVTSLPQHGSLTDPSAGPIDAVPYTLAAGGYVVTYTAATDYQGPDAFHYQTLDGPEPDGLPSNTATVTLSVGTPVAAYVHLLNENPGWLTEGDWAFGRPLGQGGDPTSGYTGLNVFGYNLAGQYPPGLPPTHLTTLPFNCTGMTRVTVNFARWLGVEASAYDNASISATNDGSHWTTVWAHSGGDLDETQWSLQSHTFAPIADDQPFVQLRWTMGPTDGNTQAAGWNIDDIQITGIGTPPSNQPPYAFAIGTATAKNVPLDVALDAADADNDSLTYTVVELPTDGVLSDPIGGDITAVPYSLAGGGNVVTYTPATDFTGIDRFRYQAFDGDIASNETDVVIHVLDPAPFPYVDDFEAGPALASHWLTESSFSGRIRITTDFQPMDDRHLVMDSATEGSFASNVLTLSADLTGHSQVLLRYDWKSFDDEPHSLPQTWTGSATGDGVAISEDGVTWHRIANLFDANLPPATYQTVTIDLDAASADAGLTYNNTFRVRFQQYDNYPVDSDGIALDNVSLLQGTDDPIITTSGVPVAVAGEPYGPVELTATGGDLPLAWTTPIVYWEESFGVTPFPPTGVAQGWHADDAVFDYPLPFAFPFYGGSYTAVKIATDGWINFGPYVGSTHNNSVLLLSYNKRIAALWDDLRTDMGGDVYVDDQVPGAFTVRWDAVTRVGLHPCNFSATLYDDGRIRLDYGDGNTGLSPTIGVSAGDTERYLLSVHDGQPTLTDADSVEFDYTRLPDGIAMTDDGVLSGTPTAAGTFRAMLHVVDQSGRTDTRTIFMTVVTGAFGDHDMDGDIDLRDFAGFQDCFSAMDGGIGPGCENMDFNLDGTIDLLDYAQFFDAVTGPN